MANNQADVQKFFDGSDLTQEKLAEIVGQGLEGSDFGEFYQEIVQRENLSKSKGIYNISLGNSSSGYGFRVGKGEQTGYAYAADFNEQTLRETVSSARQILKHTEAQSQPPAAPEQPAGRVEEALYTPENPMLGMDLAEKIAKMDEIEAYAKSLHADIVNVSLSYAAKSTDVHVMREDGKSLTDTRPVTRFDVSITLRDAQGKTETGTASLGGLIGCRDLFNEAACKEAAQDALKQAQTLLVAEDAPSGIMDVVLAPGWGAVLLHEAIGHGFEGDFTRKGVSVYSGQIGTRIAGPEVTIIDQGDMQGERGSQPFDDEGTRTQKNVLVQNGVLTGYMHDRQSALLTGTAVTGNGRRETFEDLIMPRMTNTYFANGPHDPEDILKSVKYGLFISDMGGGQVDITSGKFNMQAKLAYIIRDGKICEPVKGATLTGEGHDVIGSITMVGNDLKLEKSAGMCGKNGQSVIVSVGQPTIRVANMTVGGPK